MTNLEPLLVEQVQPIINLLIERVKASSFTVGYEPTDEEALGLVLAKYFEWNGKKIMEATAYALEDSNYHTECKVISEMSEDIKIAKKLADALEE